MRTADALLLFSIVRYANILGLCSIRKSNELARIVPYKEHVAAPNSVP